MANKWNQKPCWFSYNLVSNDNEISLNDLHKKHNLISEQSRKTTLNNLWDICACDTKLFWNTSFNLINIKHKSVPMVGMDMIYLNAYLRNFPTTMKCSIHSENILYVSHDNMYNSLNTYIICINKYICLDWNYFYATCILITCHLI